MLIIDKTMQTNAEERDLDTSTEDLPANDENDETRSTTDESSEVPEEQETGSTSNEDDSVSVSRSELEKLRREAAAAKRLREKNREGGQENRKETPQYDQELIERTFLASMAGISDPDVQDEALKMGKKLGMTVTELVKDDFFKERIAFLQKQKVAKRSIDNGKSGSATQQKGVDYWVKKYKQDGSMPDDPKILAKMMDVLGE